MVGIPKLFNKILEFPTSFSKRKYFFDLVLYVSATKLGKCRWEFHTVKGMYFVWLEKSCMECVVNLAVDYSLQEI